MAESGSAIAWLVAVCIVAGLLAAAISPGI
jgi:hypothetical protein